MVCTAMTIVCKYFDLCFFSELYCPVCCKSIKDMCDVSICFACLSCFYGFYTGIGWVLYFLHNLKINKV